jgi:hypothetical protein
VCGDGPSRAAGPRSSRRTITALHPSSPDVPHILHGIIPPLQASHFGRVYALSADPSSCHRGSGVEHRRRPARPGRRDRLADRSGRRLHGDRLAEAVREVRPCLSDVGLSTESDRHDPGVGGSSLTARTRPTIAPTRPKKMILRPPGGRRGRDAGGFRPMAINPDDWSSASRCTSFQMIGDQRRATGLSRPTVYRILGEDCQASSQSRSAYPGRSIDCGTRPM